MTDESKVTTGAMTALGPNNYRVWVKELKGIAQLNNVWKYVDPDETKAAPAEPERPKITDYKKLRKVDNAWMEMEEHCQGHADLQEHQAKSYKADRVEFQDNKSDWDSARLGLINVYNAIMKSARPYIPHTMKDKSCREIIVSMKAKFGRSNTQLAKEFAEQVEVLKGTAPVKGKVEAYIREWETLFQDIEAEGLGGSFNEELFTADFLRCVKRFAPSFCETWSRIKASADQPLKLIETTNRFRVEYPLAVKEAITHQAHAATLQGRDQPKSNNNMTIEERREKFKGRKCICGSTHIYDDCPYLNSKIQKKGWKSDTKIREEIRIKVVTNPVTWTSCKKVCNTNILDGLTPPPPTVKKGDKKTSESTDAQDQSSGSKFSLTAFSSYPGGSAIFRNSVIYDGGCTQHITWDSSRFCTEIKPAQDWLSTAQGVIEIVGYGSIQCDCILDGETHRFTFTNCAYVPEASTTLISASQLKNTFGAIWDMTLNCVKVRGEKRFDLIEKEGLYLIEFNPVDIKAYANYIGPRDGKSVPEGSANMFHLRLGHCQPQAIKRLAAAKIIKINEGDEEGPKAIDCETCAVSKMHQFIQKRPTQRATRPLERLHFDLIILRPQGFDGTTCIAHFADDYSGYSWVFPLSDHKQNTLLGLVEHIINLCDRLGYESRFLVQKIRMDQDTSFGNAVQNFVQQRGLTFEWSARDTPEQNGAAERSGGLLTEKARCLFTASKLPEDLFPEYYLAANYIMNRTPSKRLDWKSPLIAIQRATIRAERYEVSHLKSYGCKAYVLFKGPDAAPKGQKMKARAFIGYLVGYDSENIFRIWNPETWTVRGYRDALFDESVLYNQNEEEELVDEHEPGLVEYPVLQAEPYMPRISEDEGVWESAPINDRPPPVNPPPFQQQERVNEVRQQARPTISATPMVPGSYPQTPGAGGLPTPETTPNEWRERPYHEFRRDLNPAPYRNPDPVRSSYGNLQDSIFNPENPQFIGNTMPTRETLASLPETGTTPLGPFSGFREPAKIKTKAPKVAKAPRHIEGNLTPSNIVEGKRVRKEPIRFGALALSYRNPLVEDDQDSNDEVQQSGDRHFRLAYFSGAAHKVPHRDELPEEPKYWRSMLKHPHAEGFKKAAEAEIQALNSMGTWKVVPKRPGITPLPMMWRFLYKFDEKGYLTKYKARVCARGDLQDVTEDELYAATLAMKRFRALAALIAAYRLKTRQLDAINAFINADNNKPIYCLMPDGYTIPGMWLQVNRAIYGLRTSPLLWLQELSRTLENIGLTQVPNEPCLYTDFNGILVIFYVDDVVFVFAAERAEDVEQLIAELNKRYKFRDMGTLHIFLGVRFIHDLSTDAVYLCQDSYISKLAATYSVDLKSKFPTSPLPTQIMEPYTGEPDPQRTAVYRKKIGSICYPANQTRPDVARAASDLARHLINPGPDHMAAADHCLRYLVGTKYLGIQYTATGGGELSAMVPNGPDPPDKEVFEPSADASFGNGPDRKSNEGYAFKLFGGIIDWAARKQTTVSTSTTEAELLAMLHAGKEVIGWMNLFEALRFDYHHKVVIYNDNLQTLRILTADASKVKTKLAHVDIAQSWLRQSVKIGHLNVAYTPTGKMIADGLTKILTPQRHELWLGLLGMVDLQDIIENSE